MSDPLLVVDDLRTRLSVDGGVEAVDGISFTIEQGETVCLVGESGSGKSLVCDSITQLVRPPAEHTGTVRFDGRDLLSVPDDDLRSIRGDRIAYVFQNAQNALDPVYTIGSQIDEAIRFHRDIEPGEATERATELLGTVGLSRPGDRLDQYPHELSDGMCQRAAIAIALASDPDLLIADEPTSALDVMVQARIIDLLTGLQQRMNLSMLLVTHDLRVAAQLADSLVVLYDGTVVEHGPTAAVLDRPAHPYTQSLVRSFIGEGDATPTEAAADGCRFRNECPHAIEACTGTRPPLHSVDENHIASCVFHGPDRGSETVLFESRTLAAELTVHRARSDAPEETETKTETETQ